MKTIYQSPQMKVAKVKVQQQMLSGSSQFQANPQNEKYNVISTETTNTWTIK